VLLLAALAAYPAVASGYGLRFMLQLFLWVALAQSWNLLAGLTGYVSFGHAAFHGVGAYACGILVARAGLPWPLACLAAGGAAAAVAAAVGWPCLRLRGPYFAVAMLAVAEGLRVLASALEGLTGGGYGLSLPTGPASTGVYYAAGALALALGVLTWAILRTRYGLRLLTIREDEGAAEAVGIDTLRHKLGALLLSAAGAGVAGGLAARDQGYIEPTSAFAVSLTVTAIAMVLLGGQGTVAGPVVGGVALVVVQELLWARFLVLHQFLLGAVLVGVVVALPEGLVGLLRRRYALPRAF
jgi:branched-chain amino acid transport system permease protein